MNNLRAITCPSCKNRTDQHLWCDTCYGSRVITLAEAPRKAPLNRKALWRVFWLCFGLTLLTLWALLRSIGL